MRQLQTQEQLAQTLDVLYQDAITKASTTIF
jgi:hypothetical protein